MSAMVIGSHILKITKTEKKNVQLYYKSQSNPSYITRQIPSGFSYKLELPAAPDYNTTESRRQTKFHILRHIAEAF